MCQLYPTGWLKQLEGLLMAHPGESGIVYCLSKRKTEDTVEWLNDQGIRALAYHAGQHRGLLPGDGAGGAQRPAG